MKNDNVKEFIIENKTKIKTMEYRENILLICFGIATCMGLILQVYWFRPSFVNRLYPTLLETFESIKPGVTMLFVAMGLLFIMGIFKLSRNRMKSEYALGVRGIQYNNYVYRFNPKTESFDKYKLRKLHRRNPNKIKREILISNSIVLFFILFYFVLMLYAHYTGMEEFGSEYLIAHPIIEAVAFYLILCSTLIVLISFALLDLHWQLYPSKKPAWYQKD